MHTKTIASRTEQLSSDQAKAPPEENKSGAPFRLHTIRFTFRTVGNLFPEKMADYAFRLFSTPRLRAVHKVSDVLIEQAVMDDIPYEDQYLKSYSWGDSGPIILLVHGWESRGTAMRSFVPPLLQAGFRVVAFDGPAHGDSGWERTNLPHFAGAVQAVIQNLGGVEGAICHSFGGASTVFALSQPDNKLSIEKLVLIGVPNSLTKVIQHYLHFIRAPKQVRRIFWKKIESGLKQKTDAVELAKAYTALRVKSSLIVHDEEDKVVGIPSAQAIAESWPHSTFVVTKGYGHFRLMKNPDVLERVVKFFKA